MSLPIYNSGTPVSITVQLPTADGQVVPVTAVSMSVVDESDTPLSITVQVPTVDGDTSVTSMITGDVNVLAAGVAFSARTVITTMTTASGDFTDRQVYLVRGDVPLARMKNSFQTMSEAVVTRMMLPKADGWDSASDDRRIAAMASAYKNMQQLRYRFPIGENSQSRISDFYGTSIDNVFGRVYMVLSQISFYNETDFEGWIPEFKDALRRAQLAEADVLLNGDLVGEKRRQGIVSETTGESSMDFRNVPDIVMPVSREALQHLRGFLNNSVVIARG